MSFHNMRSYGESGFTAPSAQFDTWLTDSVLKSLAREWLNFAHGA
jgi:hypothetical protein